ncbi:MAG: glycosyltransferase family 2 protein [Sphaerochaeta sp.]|jgi:glycosyltransferase involved in cell wall biosynthesis|nr:glycosyltransferase family 2 protein [Sphaerochaeta sp.]
MKDMGKVIVALPAFNEEKHVADVVSRAKRFADVVVVLDDGSTDGTARVARQAGAEVIQHPTNRGYGAAMQDILSSVRGADFNVLVTLDSDGQHYPEDIPKLVDAIQGGADLAIGRRDGSAIPFYRRVGGTVLSIFTCILSGVQVKDSQCGFRAYSQKAVELIKPVENGMSVCSEIIGIAGRAGLRIVEVPVDVTYLKDSSTYNPWKQGIYTLWRIIVMLARRGLS